MNNLETINAALTQARSNAANLLPAGQAGLPASPNPTPGRAVSMREMLSQSSAITVKMYLKVDRVAFLLSKDEAGTLFQEFDVEFRFNEAKPFFGLRYGQSPAKYDKSYDRQVNAKTGRSWADCVAQAMQLDARCRGDYPAVDLPFTATSDIKDKKGKVIIEAGEKLGWTSSITNYKDFAEFAKPYYDLIDAGVLSENALVRGRITHVTRKGVENYGALTFDNFSVIDNGLEEGGARQ